jgi:hypothetical protein
MWELGVKRVVRSGLSGFAEPSQISGDLWKKAKKRRILRNRLFSGWTFLRNEAKGKRQNRGAPEEAAATVLSV